jgi:peptidoglycan hydrolase-like protein with peptidoglycan-binding domain
LSEGRGDEQEGVVTHGVPRTLRIGDRGDLVTKLQVALTAGGFDPGPIDGRFGSKTERAVRGFQSDRGLTVDGIVGPHTWRALSFIIGESTAARGGVKVSAVQLAEAAAEPVPESVESGRQPPDEDSDLPSWVRRSIGPTRAGLVQEGDAVEVDPSQGAG